jgi:hypothetical protein
MISIHSLVKERGICVAQSGVVKDPEFWVTTPGLWVSSSVSLEEKVVLYFSSVKNSKKNFSEHFGIGGSTD